jgi:excisionase family DNA binding protein
VNPATIREAVKAGDLQAFPVGTGREYRLREEDVDAWMTSRSWEPKGVAS